VPGVLSAALRCPGCCRRPSGALGAVGRL